MFGLIFIRTNFLTISRIHIKIKVNTYYLWQERKVLKYSLDTLTPLTHHHKLSDQFQATQEGEIQHGSSF